MFKTCALMLALFATAGSSTFAQDAQDLQWRTVILREGNTVIQRCGWLLPAIPSTPEEVPSEMKGLEYRTVVASDGDTQLVNGWLLPPPSEDVTDCPCNRQHSAPTPLTTPENGGYNPEVAHQAGVAGGHYTPPSVPAQSPGTVVMNDGRTYPLPATNTVVADVTRSSYGRPTTMRFTGGSRNGAGSLHIQNNNQQHYTWIGGNSIVINNHIHPRPVQPMRPFPCGTRSIGRNCGQHNMIWCNGHQRWYTPADHARYSCGGR